MKKLVSVTAATVLIAAGICTTANASSETGRQVVGVEATKSDTNKTPQSIFEAIWFATGPYASTMAKRVGNNDFREYLRKGSQRAEVQALAAEVSGVLEGRTPGYLEHLYGELTSGDVYRVEAAMGSTSIDVLNVMRERYPSKAFPAVKDGTASGMCVWVFAIAAVAVWDGAVAINYAGVVNVVGAVNVVGWFNASVSVNVTSPTSVLTVASNAAQRSSTEGVVAALTTALAK
ncbi:hypothetical protein [Sinomonas sp. ASV322]|uniref:hypothetical protein n=1 Tax=Sinomonas sp. ASV322 TaxID=3041920 RepID=UPI0027DCE436|nr:hypothetical protein [Sinomonas sp. ASV322]MDQ4501981.1 hypothetical protein [Sinomonas sp. ASV322]